MALEIRRGRAEAIPESQGTAVGARTPEPQAPPVPPRPVAQIIVSVRGGEKPTTYTLRYSDVETRNREWLVAQHLLMADIPPAFIGFAPDDSYAFNTVDVLSISTRG